MIEPTSARLPIARLAILVILLGLASRFVQIGLGDPPAVQAAGTRMLLRFGWLSQCPTASAAVGLYALPDPPRLEPQVPASGGDAPCQPRQTVSLNWLQGQLAAPGLLAQGEYLEAMPHPSRPECGALVLAGPQSLRAGWLCADRMGVYRLDAGGNDSGARWQIWSDGEWAQVK